MNRIIESHLFVDRMSKFGLNASNQKEMAREMTDGLKDTAFDLFLNKKLLLNEPTEEEFQKLISKFENEVYFENLNKAASYLSWVYNYSLILMCGVFEAFLFDALTETLQNVQPKTASLITKNFLQDFELSPIREKISVYKNILEIDQKEFFDFSLFTQEVQNKFSGFKQADLEEIYSKRNKAAHTDNAVISEIELDKASDVLQKIVINLAFKIHNKWGVETQMTEMMKGKNPYDKKPNNTINYTS